MQIIAVAFAIYIYNTHIYADPEKRCRSNGFSLVPRSCEKATVSLKQTQSYLFRLREPFLDDTVPCILRKCAKSCPGNSQINAYKFVDIHKIAQYFGDQKSRLRIFNFDEKNAHLILLMHSRALSVKTVDKFQS